MARLLGATIFVIGAMLSAGGAWLAGLGGSLYYLPTGIAMLLAGALLVLRRSEGLFVYLLIYGATLVWAVDEVGLDVWALLPRTLGPTVLCVAVLLAGPVLRPRPLRSRPSLLSAAALSLVFAGCAGALLRNPSVFEDQSAPNQAAPAPADGAAVPANGDWPVYGGTNAAARYSPLGRIDVSNVAGLRRAWTYHTRDLPGPLTSSPYASETTPLKVGNRLFLCTPKNIVIALDAASGRELWRFDPVVSDDAIAYSAACRGVAYHQAPDRARGTDCSARILEGTLDGRLIALDAGTGRPCAGFGENGVVDTTAGMGRTAPGIVSITSAPTVVRGVVVVGHQILDGQRRDAPSGVVKGFDAITGALRWAWDMNRPDLTGLPPEGEVYSPGTPNFWTNASGDEALGLVYLPLGVSAVDYWSSQRSETENRYASSLVALDVATGRPAWNFQTVRGDVWDYDLGSQATLLDVPEGGGTVPGLLLPTKRGDIFVLDRRTGRPLAGVEERAAPQGGVEPAQRAATQPYSLFHNVRGPDLVEADMWGLSPLDQLLCRIQFRRATYGGPFTPPEVARSTIQYPGIFGGMDWGGIAVDPVRGIVVTNYNDIPSYTRLVEREEADRLGWHPRGNGERGFGAPQAGAPYAVNINVGWQLSITKLPCKKPPYGGLRAIDLSTGRTLWDRPLGSARKNGPFGIASHMPFEIGTPNAGGSVVTAGGLIFIAATTDDLIRAVDLRSGRTLWQDVLPAGGQATPMTYEVDGRQYVAIVAGGHQAMGTTVGDVVVAYALPDPAQRP